MILVEKNEGTESWYEGFNPFGCWNLLSNCVDDRYECLNISSQGLKLNYGGRRASFV